MGQNLAAYKEEALTFRRKQKHPLAKLIAAMTKESEGMLEKLIELSNNEDSKIRLAAISKFYDVYKDSVEAENKDNITRTLLESKNPERSKNLVPEEGDSVPLVDFSTIQDVE